MIRFGVLQRLDDLAAASERRLQEARVVLGLNQEEDDADMQFNKESFIEGVFEIRGPQAFLTPCGFSFQEFLMLWGLVEREANA
jgi:hypothetical protein